MDFYDWLLYMQLISLLSSTFLQNNNKIENKRHNQFNKYQTDANGGVQRGGNGRETEWGCNRKRRNREWMPMDGVRGRSWSREPGEWRWIVEVLGRVRMEWGWTGPREDTMGWDEVQFGVRGCGLGSEGVFWSHSFKFRKF